MRACEIDDPDPLEQPLHYDRAATGLAFGGLVRRLEAAFGVPCESERDTQDSSEYGRVRVLADATGLRDADCGLPSVNLNGQRPGIDDRRGRHRRTPLPRRLGQL
ncbi:hypothetical protein ACWC98_11625 [Streptomyces goshikiensis]